MPLLEIKNLALDFLVDDASLRAVDGVSLTIEAGETVCLVGESGCGKSVTALSIAQLVPAPPARYVGGEILLEGRDVLKLSKAELCGIRGSVVSYVFQKPGTSLNPVFRVGAQIKESLKLHRPNLGAPVSDPALSYRTNKPGRRPALRSNARPTNKELDAAVVRLLKLVGIPAPESRLKDYPF